MEILNMEILEKLSLNDLYKFFTSISSIILVTSMFTEPVNIDVYFLRKLCLGFIVLGSIMWIIDHLYYNYLVEQRQKFGNVDISDEELEITCKNFTIGLNILYLFIGLLMFEFF